MEESFNQWVNRLQARVKQLLADSGKISVEELEREIVTCDAFLQNLYDHAEKNDVDLMSYYRELADIQFHLTRLRERLDERKAVPSPLRGVQEATETIAVDVARKGCLTLLFGLDVLDDRRKRERAKEQDALAKARRRRRDA